MSTELGSWLDAARLTAVFDAVTDGIAVLDTRGNLILANEAQVRINGFSSMEEMLQNLAFFATRYQFEHPQGGVVPLEEWPASRALRGDSFQNWVLKARRLDTGREWFFSFSGEPVRDEQGTVLLVVVVTRDITEPQRLECELRASEARHRALFDQAAIGVALLETSTGRFLQANQRLCTLLGFTQDELLQTRWQTLTHPDDLAPSEEGVRAMVASQAPYRAEKRCLRKDGSTRWVRLTVSPVTLPSRPTTTQIAMVEDITEQRTVTEQFHQAQKLEGIGRLAGGIAHDFNNLLTVILTCGEVLQADLEAGRAPDPEDVREINLAGRRAQDLTRQLLAFARRQLIEPVDLDLNLVVADSQKMLARMVGEDVELRTELEPDLWRTWADVGQLEQVLMNLAVNARDAMPQGGTIHFQTHNLTHGPGHAHPGQWVQLLVRDTGEGMTPEVKAHVFEPFFTTKPQGKGTGLGLATVYGIVAGAGGHLAVESEPGLGATFRVLLPRTLRVATSRRNEATGDLRGGTEAVLVVEDDPQVREVTIRAMKSGGYQVSSAALPKEALELPVEALRSVQLLITDVVMPGMDGRQLAEELCRRHPSLRVLYLSGYTRDAIAHRGVLDSGVEFLPKPFTAAGLLARVRALLDAPP